VRGSPQGAVLRPLVLEVLGTAPLSTTEVVNAVADLIAARGARRDFRGPLVPLPTRQRCARCHVEHDCADEFPVSVGLLKPHLDALARMGMVTKFSRGNNRAALWTKGELAVPDTLSELFGERG
jgi:hypothetical protein